MSNTNKGKKAGSNKPKIKLVITENSTEAEIADMLTTKPEFSHNMTLNKVQIHHEMQPFAPDTHMVSIEPDQVFCSSPLTPMGDGKLNLYATLQLHPIIKEGEYVRCPEGEKTERLFNNIHKTYCDKLDANPDLKENILSNIVLDPNTLQEKLAQPTSKLVQSIVKKNMFTGLNSKHPNYGKEDKSRGPAVRTKFWMAALKDEHRNGDYLINEATNQVCYTKVFYVYKNQLVKVTDWNVLEENFIYRGGDSKQGKKHFELLVGVKLKPPTIYWSADQGILVNNTLEQIVIHRKKFIERGGMSQTEQNTVIMKGLMGAEAAGFGNEEEEEEDLLGTIQQGGQVAGNSQYSIRESSQSPPPYRGGQQGGRDQNLHRGGGGGGGGGGGRGSAPPRRANAFSNQPPTRSVVIYPTKSTTSNVNNGIANNTASNAAGYTDPEQDFLTGGGGGGGGGLEGDEPYDFPNGNGASDANGFDIGGNELEGDQLGEEPQFDEVQGDSGGLDGVDDTFLANDDGQQQQHRQQQQQQQQQQHYQQQQQRGRVAPAQQQVRAGVNASSRPNGNYVASDLKRKAEAEGVNPGGAKRTRT